METLQGKLFCMTLLLLLLLLAGWVDCVLLVCGRKSWCGSLSGFASTYLAIFSLVR